MAPNGIWKSKIHRLDLYNGVHATSTKDNERSFIQIPDIHIDTHMQTAESDSPLTITNNDGILHATGLFADLARSTITLRSNITGQYTITSKEKID